MILVIIIGIGIVSLVYMMRHIWRNKTAIPAEVIDEDASLKSEKMVESAQQTISEDISGDTSIIHLAEHAIKPEFKKAVAITTIQVTPPANQDVIKKPVNRLKNKAANQSHVKLQATPRQIVKNLQANRPAPEVIALNILSQATNTFDTEQLLAALSENFLYLGEFGIYHRYKFKNGKGPRYFSVASSLTPGLLTPEVLHQQPVSGLVVFMELTNPKHDRIIFKQLLATAHQLTKQLSAVLCDDKREPLREETLLAYAERLQL